MQVVLPLIVTEGKVEMQQSTVNQEPCICCTLYFLFHTPLLLLQKYMNLTDIKRFFFHILTALANISSQQVFHSCNLLPQHFTWHLHVVLNFGCLFPPSQACLLFIHLFLTRCFYISSRCRFLSSRRFISHNAIKPFILKGLGQPCNVATPPYLSTEIWKHLNLIDCFLWIFQFTFFSTTFYNYNDFL